MSASLSSSPSESTTRRFSHKRKTSEEEVDIRRVVQRGLGEAPSMSILQGSSNFNISNADFNQIYGNATIIRFGDGQFTEVQRNLICDHIANIVILPDIKANFDRNFLTQSIINLPRAEAVFDDYQTKKKSGPCFEGTRVALLREMAEWATGSDESKMYILSGLAGIGKSTVAYTIASRAAGLNLLGASFFFSRDEGDRKNAKRFFTTIAYQLCVYNETFAKAIGDVLQTQRGSAAITKGPQEQLQALIVDPLRSIVQSLSRPILVVVDALDECDEEDWLPVLTGLRQLVQALPSFKVILTIRPQPYLDRFFGNQDGHKIFRLQDIENKVVDGDIRLYLKHCLSLKQVQERHPTRQWSASDDEIDSLVCAAGRLFIIASTSVRIILDKASNPAAQIKKLLCTFAQDRMPFKDLNEFYTVILRNVVPVDCDEDIVSCYQSVIGAIISIQHPLSIATLVHLANKDIEDVRAVLLNLQSVILLGDDDIPRIYHKSFPDYITDLTRCKDGNLCINPMICHMRITIRCFQIMEQHLKYNISGLGTPARFLSNEDGLAKDRITGKQLERYIPQQLRYACVYWANHLEVANIEDADIMKEVEQFAEKHMLHWFEALSLIRKLNSAHRAIRVVLKVLKPNSLDLRQLLLDGVRFISKFYETIKRSALHTYYSALPFTPTDSLLYRRYNKEAVHNVCDIVGGPEKWDAVVAILSHGELVDDVKFSLDGTMFISQGIGILKIWDAVTGTPISTILGASFAIADDFSTVATVERNAITLYDVNGSERGATFTTRANISAVAISLESSHIAAILSDRTLYLWDNGNGELIGCFDEIASHRDRCWERGWSWNRDRDRDHLQFSATGARLVYPSACRRFVRLRNGIDGTSIASLDCGSPLDCIAFSANGPRIVTLSESFLKLWNCEDGTLVGIARNDAFHIKLAISANASLIATGGGGKVTLWRGGSGSLSRVEALDRDRPIWTMTFSQDDTLAITAYDGILLKSRSFISTLPFSRSAALAFSPDSTRLAAGNGDGTVYLWDTQGIEAISSSSNKPAKGPVTALTLSCDHSRVACGFQDGAFELWETGGLLKHPITTRMHEKKKKVTTLRWSPDDKQFVSGSDDGTIKLWDGESGAPRGTLQKICWLRMEVSNTILAVVRDKGFALWDLKSLYPIHIFIGSFEVPLSLMSLSVDGTLVAAADNAAFSNSLTAPHQIIIFDVTTSTIRSIFNINSYATAFLPDNSQLVVQQSDNDDILTFNLVNQKLEKGPTFEYFMQLRNMPYWHDVPISIEHKNEQWHLEALFSGHDCGVPVLWVPQELGVVDITALGRSAIALGFENGHIIHLRLRTSPLDW